MERMAFFGPGSKHIERPFMKYAIRSIFRECADQLYVIKLLYSNKISIPHESIEEKTISERVKLTDKFELNRLALDSDTRNWEKFIQDLNLILTCMIEVDNEIFERGTYSKLERLIGILKKSHHDYKKEMQNYEVNKNKLVDLKKQYEEEELSCKNIIKPVIEKNHELMFKHDNMTMYGRLKQKCFNRYEKSRREQQMIKLKESEAKYESVIDVTLENISQEMEAHQLLVQYINESTNDYMDNIYSMVKLYDEKSEKLDIEMRETNAKLDLLTLDLEKLSNLYKYRKNEVEKWREYQCLKKKQDELQQKALDAAKNIQRWWRGTWFRRKTMKKIYGRLKPKGIKKTH